MPTPTIFYRIFRTGAEVLGLWKFPDERPVPQARLTALMQEEGLEVLYEKTLWSQVDARAPGIRDAAAKGDYREAFAGIAALQPAVARFFDDVLVMADDEGLRQARLTLVAVLRDLILGIADISEIVTET